MSILAFNFKYDRLDILEIIKDYKIEDLNGELELFIYDQLEKYGDELFIDMKRFIDVIVRCAIREYISKKNIEEVKNFLI